MRLRVWRSAQNGTLTFFGLSSDVEFAGWLMASLDSFVRQQSLEYVRPYRAGGVSAREAWKLQKAFILGCCVRINERLETISKGRWSEPVTGDGRSLVVVKGAIVSKAFAKLGLRLGVGRVRFPLQPAGLDCGAYDAGVAQIGLPHTPSTR
jgi:hypothetical protein